MTLPILWTEQAREDFVAIVDYIRQNNPVAAERLADALDSSTWALPEHPYLYRLSNRIAAYPTALRAAVNSSSIQITSSFTGSKPIACGSCAWCTAAGCISKLPH